MDEDNQTQLTEPVTIAAETSISNANHRLVQSSVQDIIKLYEQYENDFYMTSKLHHYLRDHLPAIMKTAEQTRLKNKQRNMEHQGVQERFMMDFLNHHRYYYHSVNERFFRYQDGHFSGTTEDEILHHIVSTISQQQNELLMNRKHQTKVMLLKRIKDQSILKAIPESETIQRVIHYLCPMLCSTKAETKYFLTILGDNLLRKPIQNTTHYISSMVKTFLASLNQISVEQFHIQCTNSFRHKHHDKHDSDGFRLVKIQPHWVCDSWRETRDHIQQYGLDVLCVACHYSRKYGSADDYVLDYSNDNDLREHVFHLKQKTPLELVQEFANQFLYDRRNMEEGQKISLAISASPQEETFLHQHLQSSSSQDEQGKLPWAHIQYLWKTFLESHQYPSGMYCSYNKHILMTDIFPDHYDSSTDSFVDIGSSQWPLIQKFLSFWNETITVETDCSTELELEADEIAQLYRRWLYRYKVEKKPKYSHLLKDTQIMDILAYFYPDLIMVDNKYIMNVRCSMWDKELDMETAIQHWRLEEQDEIDSVHKAYQYYAKFYYEKATQEEGHKRPLLVSKKYFERFFQGERSSP